MTFAEYYLAIKKKLQQHNLMILNCVAKDFYERDYSVDEVVATFLKYSKAGRDYAKTVTTVKDFEQK